MEFSYGAGDSAASAQFRRLKVEARRMEERRRYSEDEETLLVREDERVEWSASPDDEVPFEIPRD